MQCPSPTRWAAAEAVAIVCGVLSFVIGLGPLVSRHTTVFLVAGAALALGYWVFGEAFGQIFTGLATDPNTGPLLILLALALYPNRGRETSQAPVPDTEPEGMAARSGASPDAGHRSAAATVVVAPRSSWRLATLATDGPSGRLPRTKNLGVKRPSPRQTKAIWY